MSSPLRWFWRVYIPAAALLLALFVARAIGPAIELAVAPIRSEQRVEDIRRDGRFLSFIWPNHKLRSPDWTNLDAFLTTRTDRFAVTLYNDVSPSAEPPCTRIIPWGRSQVVPVGFHRRRQCVEIPITVASSDRLTLTTVAFYRGFAGLWELAVPLPDVVDPTP